MKNINKKIKYKNKMSNNKSIIFKKISIFYNFKDYTFEIKPKLKFAIIR